MKITLLSILLLIGCFCFAQERHLISSTSFTHQSDYSFSTSIGEPIVGLLSNNNTKLSQGFIPINSTFLSTNVEQLELVIMVYPNPISSHIFIKGIDLSKEYTYSIVGTAGNTIETKKLAEAQINASHLASGSYILSIFNSESTFKQKLIKQ